MTPTPEQLAILDVFAAPNPPPVIIITAGPGCGKSTTLGMLAHRLPYEGRTATLAVAFNKAAADDLARKLPLTSRARTLNSLGQFVWESAVPPGTDLHVSKFKSKEILRAIQDAGAAIAHDEFTDLLTLIRFAKSQGYLPPRSGSTFADAPSFTDLCALAELTPEPEWKAILDQALHRSIALAFKGKIDFDDQIYMPALFAPAVAFPTPSYLLIDEAQDLSPLQLRLLQRIQAKCTVLVGDPAQAIYAFRGAMSNSFSRIIAAYPGAARFPLQTSFRLPALIVERLRSHSPNLKTTKTEPGMIFDLRDGPVISPEDLFRGHSGSRAILCRNNAPLYRAALACIASHTRFNMADTTWGQALARDLLKVSAIHDLSSLWSAQSPDTVQDKLTAIAALSDHLNTHNTQELATAIQACLRKSNPSDSAHPIVLSTAHKAKGSEFDTVVHLDPHLIPSRYAVSDEALTQEANIRFVIESRSLNCLILLNSDQLPGTHRINRRRPDTSNRQRV